MALGAADIVITGANGQIGRSLLRELAGRSSGEVRALVRSESARQKVLEQAPSSVSEIRIVDYGSASDMEAALRGAGCVIHLVGIIKESAGARYVEAHEETCQVLAVAADQTGIERIVYLSILGSSPDSANPCLASKGRAEGVLLESSIATTILRVPMVVGGDDPASAALRKQAQSPSLRLIGGGRSLQQPIDSRDVVHAILAATTAEPGRNLVLDAGGPECLSHRDLVLRAARLFGNEPTIRSLPLRPVRFAVACLEMLLPAPPITRAMFDILQHDDQTDPDVMCRKLGIELTPLDTTLTDHIGPTSESSS